MHRASGEFEVLQRLVSYDGEYHSRKEREKRRHHGERADDEGREPLHESRIKVIHEHWDEEANGDKREDSSNDAEELKWPVVEEHAPYCKEDADAVRNGVEL